MEKRKDLNINKEGINRQLKTKHILFAIVLFIIFVIGYGVFYHYNQKSNKYKMIFKSEVGIVHHIASRSYEKNIKYFARIDGVSCESDLDMEYVFPGLNYYISFDENGNTEKLYVFGEEWRYINDNAMDFDALSISDEYVSKVKNYKLDCNGNIISG